MNSGTVHLVATDPPDNKGRDFHETPDSMAAGADFQNRWSRAVGVEGQWIDQIQDDMAAFLCFVGVRLIEMRRVPRDNGSLYLHCDPTASHDLQALLDSVFGGISSTKACGPTGKVERAAAYLRRSMVLLFYTRERSYTFNVQNERAYAKRSGRRPGRINYGAGSAKFFQDEHGVYNLVNTRDVWEVSYINSRAAERTGYPTQKPLALDERII
ncbi:MAG: site-specific DNA-methyltransferase [Chloroflexi bacterium]|nr:site-specific DNA-methyltransferase [Chloroflexota bacterium]